MMLGPAARSARPRAVIDVSLAAPVKSAGRNQLTLEKPFARAASQVPPPVVPAAWRVASSPFGGAPSGTMMPAGIVAQPTGRSSTTTASGSASPAASSRIGAAVAPIDRLAVMLPPAVASEVNRKPAVVEPVKENCWAAPLVQAE